MLILLNGEKRILNGGKNIYKKYYKKNKDKINKQNAFWRRNHPKRLKRIRRKTHLKLLYNLTLKQFNKMLKNQDYRCGICKKKKKLEVDHNHKTGKVRGLLCRRCNMGLCYVEDIKYRKMAREYLKLYDGII